MIFPRHRAPAGQIPHLLDFLAAYHSLHRDHQAEDSGLGLGWTREGRLWRLTARTEVYRLNGKPVSGGEPALRPLGAPQGGEGPPAFQAYDLLPADPEGAAQALADRAKAIYPHARAERTGEQELLIVYY